MCGIAGASLNPGEDVPAGALATSLLLGIEHRGRHATGTAWTGADGEVWLRKDAIPASRFVLRAHVEDGAAAFIAHTRWATQGSPANNDNNHPIDVAGIVGVHNGCVWNDDDLFAALEPGVRIAQVDSEAIFATLLHSGLPADAALEQVRGSAAVAWFDTRPGADTTVLHLARVSASPLVVAETLGGSLLFASTAAALRDAAQETGLDLMAVREVPEGTRLAVRDGQVIERSTFTTQARRPLTWTERRALGATA